MELLYIWIDRYNNIKDQEFHFSSDFNIKFNKELKKLEFGRSEVKKLELFYETFLNITAIIGKNGSGKSSLYSFIKEIFSRSYIYHNRSIVVTKSLDNKIYIIDNFSKNGEKIIEEEYFDESTPIIIVNNNDNVINSVYLIAHSNSFSIFTKNIIQADFLDLSFDKTVDLYSVKSNELLIKNYDQLLKEYEKEPDKIQNFNEIKERLIESILPRDFLYSYGLQSIVDFIVKYKNKSWDFVPKYLYISFNRLFYYNNIVELEKLGLSDALKEIESILNNDNLFKPDDVIQKFKDQLILYLFLYYSLSNRYYFPRNKDLDLFIVTLKNKKAEEIPSLICSFFNKSQPTIDDDSPLTNIRELILSIDTQFDSYKNLQEVNSNNYLLWIEENVSDSLRKIFDIWRYKDFIFSFGWAGLSAGEFALLNIFSKINSIASDFFGKDSIWLLVDEGDLYLHPEWQRTFFSDLHKYLPQFFKGKKIQLFIISHSPFIVSDLPKENIILIDKDDKGYCKVIDRDQFHKTFGANIHELFTHSFFLKQGLIGEFAKVKINILIEFLKGKSKSSKKFNLDKETSQKIINVIGEPLIKNQLQDMWNEKFLLDFTDDELLIKVTNLERELKLEKLKNATNKNK